MERQNYLDHLLTLTPTCPQERSDLEKARHSGKLTEEEKEQLRNERNCRTYNNSEQCERIRQQPVIENWRDRNGPPQATNYAYGSAYSHPNYSQHRNAFNSGQRNTGQTNSRGQAFSGQRNMASERTNFYANGCRSQQNGGYQWRRPEYQSQSRYTWQSSTNGSRQFGTPQDEPRASVLSDPSYEEPSSGYGARGRFQSTSHKRFNDGSIEETRHPTDDRHVPKNRDKRYKTNIAEDVQGGSQRSDIVVLEDTPFDSKPAQEESTSPPKTKMKKKKYKAKTDGEDPEEMPYDEKWDAPKNMDKKYNTINAEDVQGGFQDSDIVILESSTVVSRVVVLDQLEYLPIDLKPAQEELTSPPKTKKKKKKKKSKTDVEDAEKMPYDEKWDDADQYVSKLKIHDVSSGSKRLEKSSGYDSKSIKKRKKKKNLEDE